MTKQTNIQYLDTLRCLALLGVIVIHTTTPILKMMYEKNMEFWWIGNTIDSSVRFVIAMFLMLSGATMLGKEYKLSDYYRKRFVRVLVPFLFWLVAYWLYRWCELTPNRQPHSFDSIIKWGIALFQNEGVSKHFWYVYMILVIYLFVPFMGKWVQRINQGTLVYFLVGWVILNILVNNKIINPISSYAIANRLFTYFLYSGYLLLGYYLFKLKTVDVKFRKAAFVIFILTIMYSALATYFLSKNAHKLDTSAYGSLTINTMLQSIALVVIFKNKLFDNKLISNAIRIISDYSYGIYLVHIMVISILYNNGIFWTIAHPFVSLPLIIIMTLIISMIIIAILRKIPGGKYISG